MRHCNRLLCTVVAVAAVAGAGVVGANPARAAASAALRTPAVTAAQPQVATTQQQIVVDPGFESTDPGTLTDPYWQQYSRYASSGHSFPTIDGSFPYSGTYSTDFCGGDNCLDEVAQGFVVPSQVVSAQLYFVYNIQSQEKNGNAACHDQLTVGMAISGQLDQSAVTHLCSQTGNGRQYQLAHLDVTSWLQARSGGQVQVLAAGTTDNLYYTEFWVDDITLSITYATTPTAPTNVSASSPSAGGATLSWAAPSLSGTTPISSYTITPYLISAANPRGVPQPSTTTSSSATTGTIGGLTNGSSYMFAVAANNASGSGPQSALSNSVTPDTWSLSLSTASSVSTTSQYVLTNSDGSTWQDIDMQNLGLSFVATATGQAVLSANADLWTAASGVNQDIGIALHSSDGAFTEANALVGWKESGGGATFSPNAAYLQVTIPVVQNVTYQAKLRWKTNHSAIGATVYAAAGGPAPYSTTRLSVQQTVPVFGEGTGRTAVLSGTQGHLPANDGTSWVTMDGQAFTSATNGSPADNGSLRMTLTPGVDAITELSLNADLFTSQAGHAQDIGIFGYARTGSGPWSAPQLVAWKESGGNAGVFSPNAAYLQALWPVSAGQQYLFVAVWKANSAVSANVVYAGAGNGPYSPTRLTGLMYPQPGTGSTPQAQSTPPATVQFSRPATASWAVMTSGATQMTMAYTPAASGTVVISGNADLFINRAGPNQDLGIRISGGSFGSGTVVAWKESGGSGVYSPNAATVQFSVALTAGTGYTIALVWKTNVDSAGATIYAGAGPLGSAYSPTTLELLQS